MNGSSEVVRLVEDEREYDRSGELGVLPYSILKGVDVVSTWHLLRFG